jgi:hypothetical protein
MIATDIIVEIRDRRHDRNMVSISAHDKEFEIKLNLDGYVLIPLDGYKSSGLIKCLTDGSKKVNNPVRSAKCNLLLEYLSAGATIRIDKSIKD